MSPWPLIGAVSAVMAEAYFRAHRSEAWLSLWPAIALGVVVNLSVYKMLQHDSLVGMAVSFSLATGVLRIAGTLALGDAVPATHWVAFGLVVMASLVRKFA